MPRRLLALCLALTGLMMLVSAGPAAAATKAPSITKVSPMRLEVGDKITLRGKNFKSKRTANTIFFRGVGGRQALAKPTKASRTKLVVKVPAGVAKILRTSATRIKLRVLAGKFSKYTSPRLSPVIVPEPRSGGGGGDGGSGGGGSGGGTGGDVFVPPPGPAPPVCPSADGAVDDDGDLLENSIEALIRTNPCLADTDADGVQDGFEYKSAIDLNDDEYQDPNSSLPYPGKRPFPNPLDPEDPGRDYDGDSLTSLEEQQLWLLTITNGAARTLSPLTYSAGEQYSVHDRVDGRRTPSLAAAGYDRQADFLDWATTTGHRTILLNDGSPWYDHTTPAANPYGLLDFNRDGAESATVLGGYQRSETVYYDLRPDEWLSDNERDEDADGLTNYDESHGRMTPSYWASCYAIEAPDLLLQNSGTNLVDADSDGDGVRDGADDEDHDDIPNIMELSRIAASGLDDTQGASCKAAAAAGNFSTSGGPLPETAVTVTFEGDFEGQNVPQMTADGTGLSGGTAPAVTVTTTRPGDAGVNERQRITITGSPDGGTFTLTAMGETTEPISFNATPEAVDEALEEVLPADTHPDAYGRVNPFNACLPAVWSRTCTQHPGFGNGQAPFDDSANWLSLQ